MYCLAYGVSSTNSDSGDGVYTSGEDYIDGNGIYDLGEEFTDENGNSVYIDITRFVPGRIYTLWTEWSGWVIYSETILILS